MPEAFDLLLRGAVMGVTGSALMDVWSAVLRRRFDIPTLDYGLLGRWIGHFPKGRFVHERIGTAAPVANERAIGWIAHYGIGVAVALVMLAIWGRGWVAAPSIAPALVVGIGTIVAPWFVMQPALGLGFAGSNAPNPAATRLRNLGSHMVYGVGLFVAGLTLSIALPAG